MPLKTGRFYESAEVKISEKACTSCGLCVQVCKGAPLFIREGKVLVDQNRVFGCIACGQCMAICPNGAIKVQGRDMSPDDILPMPTDKDRTSYERLQALMLSRRSVRNFSDQSVEQELIDKIIAIASTAPNGLGASDVEILVLDSRDKVSGFVDDMIIFMKRIKWLFSPIMLKLYRPFIGKDHYESFNTFASGAIKAFLSNYDEGEDWLLYKAPLAMFFHASPYADPADPYISATYAMLAAQSLGLGSCMIGSISFLLNANKKVKQKYGIPIKNKKGIMVIFGYPALKYKYTLRRRLAGIKYY